MNGITLTSVSVEYFDAFVKEIRANDTYEQMDVTIDRAAKRANEDSAFEHEHEYAKRRNGPSPSPDKVASTSASLSDNAAHAQHRLPITSPITGMARLITRLLSFMYK